jgi:FAD binding domain
VARANAELAAEAAADYPDGVYFVRLAPVREPGLVSSSIAQGIGLPDSGGRPLTKHLASYLRDRKLLLVLDNFEHLLAAAPVVAGLLAQARNLRIVVTSRSPLRVSGEQECSVPPLALPRPDAAATASSVAACESVRLFAERAAAAVPGFTIDEQNAAAVAEIARRLDGLPLAIELAAARVRLLPPDAICGRLEHSLGLLTGGSRDLPDRQRTLRATIEWSYDLLGEEARRLLAACSVFRGGVPLEVIESDGRTRTISAGYLVGCDGAHSRVRHELGLEFRGHPYPQDWLLADVSLDWARPENEVHAFFRGDGGPLVAFPMRGHRWRLVLPLAGDRARGAPDLAEVQRLADERAPEPITVSDPTWLASFRCHRRSADAYRRGHVLLAGDAVHIHTPAGGQGMNTGITDAHNLGWKLALVVSGRAPAPLLDTYGRERQPVAAQVVSLTHNLVRYGSLTNPVQRALRDAIVPVAFRVGPVHRRAVRRWTQVNVGYPARRLTWPGWVRPGRRVPDLEVHTPDGSSRLLAVLRGGRHVMLVTGADPAGAVASPALQPYRDLFEGRHPRLRECGRIPHRIGRPGPAGRIRRGPRPDGPAGDRAALSAPADRRNRGPDPDPVFRLSSTAGCFLGSFPSARTWSTRSCWPTAPKPRSCRRTDRGPIRSRPGPPADPVTAPVALAAHPGSSGTQGGAESFPHHTRRLVRGCGPDGGVEDLDLDVAVVTGRRYGGRDRRKVDHAVTGVAAAQQGDLGVEVHVHRGVAEHLIDIGGPPMQAVLFGNGPQPLLTTPDQDGLGVDAGAVVEPHAALLADGEQGPHQVLPVSHPPGDPVHGDVDDLASWVKPSGRARRRQGSPGALIMWETCGGG